MEKKDRLGEWDQAAMNIIRYRGKLRDRRGVIEGIVERNTRGAVGGGAGGCAATDRIAAETERRAAEDGGGGGKALSGRERRRWSLFAVFSFRDVQQESRTL